MTVTEFALIKLQPSYDELELYECFMQLLEIQDEWIRRHQPHLLKANKNSNLSSVYKTKSDPSYLLIIAPWDSPDGHQEWLNSEENKAGMAELRRYIAPGDDSVLLFHMEPAGQHKGPPPSFVRHTCFNVDRIFVEPGDKETVQAKYRKVEGALQDLKLEDQLWGGWRIEKPGNTEELVVFSSHSKSPLEKAVQKIGLTQRKESYCFHHIVG